MTTVAEALDLAMRCHQAGDFGQAEHVYRQILDADPQHVNALYLLGLLAHQVGRSDRAIEYLGTAVRLQPGFAAAHKDLGDAFQAQGQLDDAIGCYRQAVRLRPDYAEANLSLGAVLTERGLVEEALAAIHQALHFRPDFPEAHYNLGVVRAEQGRTEEALASYRQALVLRPDYAEAHHNLGIVLMSQRLLDEAVASFRQALRLQPGLAEAHNNLGLVFLEQRKLPEAAECFQHALNLQPNHPGFQLNLGNLFVEQGRLDEAVASFTKALRLGPDSRDAHNSLALGLLAQGRLEEAIACHREAYRLSGEYPESLLMCLNYSPSATPASILAEHCAWADRHASAGAAAAHANSPDPDRRLRVGYVSPDFRLHAVASFIEPILAHHDPARVESFCYAEVPAPDATTARLRSLAHGWRSTCGLSDAQAAARIRADGIDLLVDLAGHTNHNRLQVFAHKPAPVQLTYLGYPSTTGLTTIDYRLTDAVADPPGEPPGHTEELWRLPGCFCCFAPPAGAPAVARAPAERRGQVTFGSFHGLAKLNGAVLDLWCRLLHALPAARLLVCRHILAGEARARLAQEFERHGIAPGRFEMRPEMPAGSSGFLGLYAEVDVLLDPIPWGGHTTACEALWMGVPVLTLSGDRHAGRMVTSVLHCLDLAEWVARTPAEYIERGVHLTSHLDGLAQLRRQLRERMRTSPLCDGLAFTRRLEEAYRAMWQRWCAARSR